jgi:hypothetical protein
MIYLIFKEISLVVFWLGFANSEGRMSIPYVSVDSVVSVTFTFTHLLLLAQFNKGVHFVFSFHFACCISLAGVSGSGAKIQ